MPAPSTPTGFTLASRARPHSITGNGPALGTSGPHDAVKLTYTLSSGWPRLQMQFGSGVWLDAAAWRGGSVMTGGFTRVDAASALIFGIAGTPGSAVNFRLRAENADGASAWTSTLTFNLSNTIHGGVNAPNESDLAAPGGLAVAVNTADELKLTWNDDENDESRYEVELRALATGLTLSLLTGAIADPFATLLSVVPGTLGVVHNTAYAARVRARCVKAFSGYSYTEGVGDWSSEVFFTTAATAVRLLNLPASVDFWRTVAGSYVVRTNVPATSITTGTLPTGLTLTGALIAGTVTAAVGSYAVNITADGDTKVLTFVVRQPALALRVARGGSGEYVDAGTVAEWSGVMDEVFTVAVKALVSGPISSTITLSLAGAPAWLAVSGTDITGTPTAPGEWLVTVTGTNGTQSGTAVLKIVVAAAAITSTSHTVYEQLPFSFTIPAVPAAAVLSIDGLPSWLRLVGRTLSGTPPEPTRLALAITAAVDGYAASGAFELIVLPAIGPSGGGSSAIDEDPWIIEGHVGEILIEAIGYFGAGVLTAWQLAGAPSGLTVQELTLWAPYGGARRDSIQGSPVMEGRFEATLSATVSLPDGTVAIFRRAIEFRIQGALYLPWLHPDRSLYDLQVQVRGDAVARVLQSYYGVPARAASTSVETVGGVVTTTQNAALPGNLLTLKLRDRARLAIVIRDGKHSLGAADVSDVRFTLRLPTAVDGQYIVSVAATASEVGEETYFLAEFEVSHDWLKELVADDSVTSVSLLAEVFWHLTVTPSPLETSSATGTVTIAEDVTQ